MKLLKKNSFIIVVMVLLNSAFTHAQDDFGPPPPPQSPIDSYVLVLTIMAILTAAYFILPIKKRLYK